jgi:multiple sugar transport system permease protein
LKILVWILRCLLVVISLAPFYWLVTVALSPTGSLYRESPGYAPWPPVLENFRVLLADGLFARQVGNSLAVAAGTTIITLVAGSSAAYALSRIRFGGKGRIMLLFLGLAIFPPVGLVGPIYLSMSRLGLVNNYLGLILPYTLFSLPLSVWVLTHYFARLPRSLEEAAFLDGCSPAGAFPRIILPVSLPGMATAAILIFIFAWNEFLLALILTSAPESRTVPVALALFSGLHHLPWGTIAAATVVSMIPLLILVILFERRIAEGLTAGAVRG